MMHIVKPGTNFDFMGKAPLAAKLTVALTVLSLVLIFIPGFGLKLGLDFSGGYEMLLAFDKEVQPQEVRDVLGGLQLGDTSVQNYEITDSPKTHYLVRVQRAEVLSDAGLKEINDALAAKYGQAVQTPVKYNPEAGNVIEVVFTSTSGVDTSSAALAQALDASGHPAHRVRNVGTASELRYSVGLRGVDTKIVAAMRDKLDPAAQTIRVDFVGPAIGKQLRDDGILAMVYAMAFMLLYIALRFDLFYGPGAIVVIVHNAIVTVGLLVLLRREFNLTTIAGLLTLIGYSINDTIVVYDRIRETVGKAQGHALHEIVNKAVNEMLGRTLMISLFVLLSCICLMIFGEGTVLFDFGLIMAFGVVIGTYSSIYIAAPVFAYLRGRFGPKDNVGRATSAAAARARAAEPRA